MKKRTMILVMKRRWSRNRLLKETFINSLSLINHQSQTESSTQSDDLKKGLGDLKLKEKDVKEREDCKFFNHQTKEMVSKTRTIKV